MSLLICEDYYEQAGVEPTLGCCESCHEDYSLGLAELIEVLHRGELVAIVCCQAAAEVDEAYGIKDRLDA